MRDLLRPLREIDRATLVGVLGGILLCCVLVAGRDCSFRSAKARRLLGYAPTVGLEEAVMRSVAWYRTT